MNKKASTNITLLIIIILVIILIAAVFYFVSNRRFSTNENVSDTLINTDSKNSVNNEINNFQKILDEYSACVNSNDIECQCKYLTNISCINLRKGGIGSEAIYAIGSKLIKNLGDAKFSFIAGSGEYQGSCLQIIFIEENGKWKVYDVDGPLPSAVCK